ncbi:hypothetical protein BJ912DRAFT_869510 [Pholiota molesta]|nr:hypothetical protein BJ912DRAFT_869510 [Pholiota molesta]
MHHSIDITKLAAAAAHPLSTSTFDHVLNRLQNLTLPEAGLQKHQLDGEALFAAYPKAEERTVIDTFAPRRTAHDRSPTSSQSSSDAEYSSSSNYSASQPASPTAAAHEAFYATRSRVVRQAEHRAHIPIPATLWELRDEVVAGRRASSVWAVFRTHEEACAALALSGRAMSVATALESDLEPFHKLHRVLLTTVYFASVTYPHSAHSHPQAPTPTLPPPRHLALDLPPPSPSRSRMPELTVAPPMGEYTLSSNPPNPKTSFRLGDWICPSPNCAAHNFGRNLACIGCGCPRSAVNGANTGAHTHNHQHQHALNPQYNAVFTQTQSSTPTAHNLQNFRSSSSSTSSSPPISIHAPHTQPAAPVKATAASASSSSAHPLLTPSGRAFAVGGKVQNISSDPLSPCVMYWPDNEPFPEQGQIRPSCMAGIAPPILNTGNRGPISHVSFFFACMLTTPKMAHSNRATGSARSATTSTGVGGKCARRAYRVRVSPFLPSIWALEIVMLILISSSLLSSYAEGNGDSISAAVQAERIALLTSVLSQTSLNGGSTLDVPTSVHRHGASPAHGQRSHSLTPPQSRRPFIDLPSAVPGPHASHAQSQVHSQGSSLQQIASYTASSPIYQTSGHRQPSPIFSTGPDAGRMQQQQQTHPPIQAPAPLLPSFLQDMVQSPALSPTSTTTSSAELSSIEEYDEQLLASPPAGAPQGMFGGGPRARGDSGSTTSDAVGGASPLANIWRLDGEESKSLSAFPLPNHQELVGAQGRVVGRGDGPKIRA